jgi:hypothetical protein
VIVLVAVLAGSSDDEVAAEGSIDGIVLQELAETPHAEARSWVDNNRHFLMGMRDPVGALGFVNEMYSAGAVDVQVVGIEGSPMRQLAGTLVVELPPSAEEREAVMAVCTRATTMVDGVMPIAVGAQVRQGERYLRIELSDPDRGRSQAGTLHDSLEGAHKFISREKRGL